MERRALGRGDLPPLPKLVLFDLDDTLFDHAFTCRAALSKLRGTYSLLRGRPLDALWREYGRLLAIDFGPVALGRRAKRDARAERFRTLAAWCGRPVDAETAATMSVEYRDHYQLLRRPVPGAPEFLHRLEGRARIGVVTNNTVAEQVEKLRFLGLERVVDPLVTSEEVGAAKPAAELFRAALDRGGAGSEDTVMVGDHWEADIVGARAAGIRAIWFNRFREPRPAPAAMPEFDSFRPAARLERLLRTDLPPP